MTLTPTELLLLGTIVIWFIRLEAKVLYQGKDQAKLEESVKAKDKLLWEKFDVMREDVSKILQAVSFLRGQASNKEVQSEKTF